MDTYIQDKDLAYMTLFVIYVPILLQYLEAGCVFCQKLPYILDTVCLLYGDNQGFKNPDKKVLYIPKGFRWYLTTGQIFLKSLIVGQKCQHGKFEIWKYNII